MYRIIVSMYTDSIIDNNAPLANQMELHISSAISYNRIYWI